MPVKTWEPQPDQQDRVRQGLDRGAAEPGNVDRAMRAADANEDVPPGADRNGGEDINTHGSQR